MKNFLIEYKALEAYNGSNISGKVLVVAEDVEKAWVKAIAMVDKEYKDTFVDYRVKGMSLVDCKLICG